jgi:IclR family acetate operon transcriptional repressor
MTTLATGRSTSGPKVVEKALRVLDLFTVEQPSWSVTEIARQLDLPTATAHRIVRALEDRSFLTREGTRYRLGLAAVERGRRATASLDLRLRLGPVLRELAYATRETALLTVYDESRHGSLCVDRIEGTHDLRLSIEVGRVTPIHAGASAKALLAFLDEVVVEDVLSRPLERLARGTIVDRRKLRTELDRIRTRGWAFSYEENNVGAWGLAAPILVGERAVASVGFAAPTARHSRTGMRSVTKLVLAAARDSEARLDSAGFSGARRRQTGRRSAGR